MANDLWRIYHNPRCSKSRQTLELLRNQGIEPEIIEYLKDPPSVEELRSLTEALGFSSPRQLVRKKEPLYADQRLESASDERLLKAMSQHAALIERPIVVRNSRAVLGRPPENINHLL